MLASFLCGLRVETVDILLVMIVIWLEKVALGVVHSLLAVKLKN